MQKLLIANRGEIARRIIRTAHRMGIATVAVFSDADRHALHVREAGQAVHIGPSPAAESYLDVSNLLAAAAATGADAVHPGYGFLSENADFADAVRAAGLTFVGPPAAAMRAMGLKDGAKAVMKKAGVPTTPGYQGDDQSLVRLERAAAQIGFPLLIKAVAGGGGKGMRAVHARAEFAEALLAAQREAGRAFGNDGVLLEKLIARAPPRRGPGLRRRRGQRRPPVRARLLAPAPPPEGHRGGPRPRPVGAPAPHARGGGVRRGHRHRL